MSRGPFRIALALGVATAAAACAPSAVPPTSERAANRIVSLTPALTEILFAVGAGDRVVGVTAYCDYPPVATSLPKVGGYVNPSVEAVLALSPDLVVVSPGPGNREAALAMQRSGLRLEVVAAETLDESIAAIERVGVLCGEESAGRALAAEVRDRLNAVSKRVAERPRVRALFCLQIDPIIAAGQGTLPGQLLEVAGGRNVVDAPRYPRLGIESIFATKPEVILQARMDRPEAGAERLEETFWSRWPAIPAVASGRVRILSDGQALRPGPRVAQAAESLAAILHPEVFPEGSQR